MNFKIVQIKPRRIGDFSAQNTRQFLELSGVTVPRRFEHEAVHPLFVSELLSLFIDLLEEHPDFQRIKRVKSLVKTGRVLDATEILDRLQLHRAVRSVDADMTAGLRAA